MTADLLEDIMFTRVSLNERWGVFLYIFVFAHKSLICSTGRHGVNRVDRGKIVIFSVMASSMYSP